MLVEYFDRLRKKPREARMRFVVTVSYVVMVIVTIVWLPLFFRHASRSISETANSIASSNAATSTKDNVPELRPPFSE